MASFKRILELATKSGVSASKFQVFHISKMTNAAISYRSLSSHSPVVNYFGCRRKFSSSSANRPVVDTLALVKALKAQGIPSQQVDAIIEALNPIVLKADMQKVSLEEKGRLPNNVEDIGDVKNGSLEDVSSDSKADEQKAEMAQEMNLVKLISDWYQLLSCLPSKLSEVKLPCIWINLYWNARQRSSGRALKCCGGVRLIIKWQSIKDLIKEEGISKIAGVLICMVLWYMFR